ncbi:MAG: hypothetical protein KGL39_14465 [Patescibacteria group bacterium]|nr:hypothetical protein [Patescibacteria group bacterium]
MPITLGAMRASVREHIDEPTANYWTDAEINDYIVKEQLNLWRRIYRLRDDYWIVPGGFQFNTVAGQYAYQTADGIPANFFRATALRCLTSGYSTIRFLPADPSSPRFVAGLDPNNTIASPDTFLYAVRGNGILWLSPTPQQVMQIQADYIALPTAVALDTDTFTIPDEFLDYIEYSASADALMKQPSPAAGTWAQKAENAWSDIQAALDTQRTDQGPEMVRGFGDDGEW